MSELSVHLEKFASFTTKFVEVECRARYDERLIVGKHMHSLCFVVCHGLGLALCSQSKSSDKKKRFQGAKNREESE